MEKDNLRHVEATLIKGFVRKSEDLKAEDVDCIVGYFHGWYSETGEDAGLYGIVETYNGKIRLVPYKELTFTPSFKPTLPNWAKVDINEILIDIRDINVGTDSWKLDNVIGSLEKLIE